MRGEPEVVIAAMAVIVGTALLTAALVVAMERLDDDIRYRVGAARAAREAEAAS